jgi:hypothetical protein
MPYQEGDTEPPHINVHNEFVAEVQAFADAGGIEVVLPPVRGLGDNGHVDDHNLLTDALAAIAEGGGPGFGTPPAAVIDDVTGNVITFQVDGEGDAGPTLAYAGAVIKDSGEVDYAATVAVEWSPGEQVGTAQVRGVAGGTHTVEIYGFNLAGKGQPATTTITVAFAKITGGDLENGSIIDDYNGTGEQWKVHQWTANGSLTVDTPSSTGFPFHVLLCGQGGRGGGDQGGGGGGGAVVVDDDAYLPRGEPLAVTVNNPAAIGTTYVARKGGNGGSYDGGNGGTGGNGGGGGGGNSGGGGGATGAASPMGTTYQRGGTARGGFGSPGEGGGAGSAAGAGGVREAYVSNITGSDKLYGGGGRQGANGPGYGGNSGAGGAGGGNSAGASGNVGSNGVVVVAYQVGWSTPEQIRVAQAVRKARAEGYTQGQDDYEYEMTEKALALAAKATTKDEK